MSFLSITKNENSQLPTIQAMSMTQTRQHFGSQQGHVLPVPFQKGGGRQLDAFPILLINFHIIIARGS